ncbi:MAG: flavin reductase family protein [Pseudomonadota bacterium]|nr:flavin reductase family protein [Pseudomonadota bacterium]
MNTSSLRGESARAAFDPRSLRACFGKFATGVTVVSLLIDGKPHGLTVNSFTSVSLDPPLVLICVDKGSKSADALGRAPFAINVLTAKQEDYAWHFAGRALFTDIPWHHGQDGLPFLPDTLARILCAPWSVNDGGDHLVVIGKVFDIHSSENDALAFFSGQFSRLQPGKAQKALPKKETSIQQEMN